MDEITIRGAIWHTSVEDEEFPGPPTRLTILEVVEKFHNVLRN